ncbi:formin-like protein 18 [Lynx rufus]|uniref:formin-like protein 18 n=1 Tax=Lynx rufus TaxID=61384 RepID=UPI001F127316|nr:formin-like protein 18 [Lynx rufus]
MCYVVSSVSSATKLAVLVFIKLTRKASEEVSTLQWQSSLSATQGSPKARVRPRRRSATFPPPLATPGPHLPLAPREPQRVGREAGGSTLSPLAPRPHPPRPSGGYQKGRQPAPLPSGTLPSLGACEQTPLLSPSAPRASPQAPDPPLAPPLTARTRTAATQPPARRRRLPGNRTLRARGQGDFRSGPPAPAAAPAAGEAVAPPPCVGGQRLAGPQRRSADTGEASSLEPRRGPEEGSQEIFKLLVQ